MAIYLARALQLRSLDTVRGILSVQTSLGPPHLNSLSCSSATIDWSSPRHHDIFSNLFLLFSFYTFKSQDTNERTAGRHTRSHELPRVIGSVKEWHQQKGSRHSFLRIRYINTATVGDFGMHSRPAEHSVDTWVTGHDVFRFLRIVTCIFLSTLASHISCRVLCHFVNSAWDG
jgi:hypothetical protein